MRAAIVLVAALGLVGAVAVRQDGPSDSDLAPGEGREVVEAVCTSCHTAQNIVASYMSREAWATTIVWMQETQGLSELEPDVLETVLDYLEATQGLDAADVEASDSPWAYPLYRPNPIW